MGDSTTVQAPQQSPEELALLQEQTAMLRDQRAAQQQALKTQNLLQPLLFKNLGLTANMDASGNITGFTEDPAAQKARELNAKFGDLATKQLEGELANAPVSQEIQRLTGERSLAALKGELPVDAGLTRQLDLSEQQLRANLQKNLGPGYETSTPGMTALAEFERNKSITLDQARRGDLSLAEQLSQARSGTQFGQATGGSTIEQNLKTGQFGNLMGAPSGALPIINAGTNIAGAFSGPLASYQNQRQMQLQAATFNANAENQASNAMWSGIGMIGGMAAGGYLGSPTGSTQFSKLFG